ncbi:MAG: rhomboid family intramembrane serine protease [bacterium]|jgi:membrane associated rhomboid family serine protease
MSITFLIIIITAVVSFIAFNKESLKDDLLFWPFVIKRKGELFRFFTYGALHADVMHLLFNMLSFYSFGLALEEYLFKAIFGDLSRAMFAIMYITAIIASVIPDFFKYQDKSYYRSLGASGAVSAVVFSAITIQPTMPIRFFFIPFNIPGYVFGIVFLVLSAMLAKRGGGNIGHNAHFWGSVYGILFTYLAAKFISGIDLLGYFIESVF